MISLPWEGDWPVTRLFGVRAKIYTDLNLYGHNGLDVGCPTNTPLRAWKEITIVETDYDPQGYGFYTKGRTPAGEDLLFAHMSLWGLPRPGTHFDPGERVGYSGSSGLSTGPHVHIGYRPDHTQRGYPFNGYADPLPLLTGG